MPTIVRPGEVAWVGGWIPAIALLAVLAGGVTVWSLRQCIADLVQGLWLDLRFAFRSLVRHPGVTLLSAALLAIGIGANVTVFSIADVIMLRPLPFAHADQLVEVHGSYVPRGWRVTDQSLPDILDIRQASHTLEVAGWYDASFNMAIDGDPERVQGRRVSWSFFDVLQTRPIVGRTFRPDEEAAGNDRVAVITFGLWQRRFAGDPAVVGRTIALDGQHFTVVGVLPAGFWFKGQSTEVWTPFGVSGEESRSSRYLNAVARLETGSRFQQARVEVETIASRLAQEYPDTNRGWGAGIRPLREGMFDSRFRSGSLIAAVATGFLLLIACANVSNLLLARAAGRIREISIRESLGASPARITAQLLTEGGVVAGLAGVAGTAMAQVGVKALVAFVPGWFSRIGPVDVGGRALLFALAVSALAGLASAALPALRNARTELVPGLKQAGRGTVTPAGGSLRALLVVVEVSLALTLVVCSVLLLQGFERLQRTPWGWSAEHVLTFKLALPENQYGGDDTVISFYEELRSGLREVPGIKAAGGIEILPLEGESSTFYEVVGREGDDPTQRPVISTRAVLPGYFETMGIPVVEGATITDAIRPDTRLKVVINRTLAERHWPTGDPIGQHLRFWREDLEVIGVVADTLDVGRTARPMGFVAATQVPLGEMTLVVRTSLEPEALAPAVRDVVARLDPTLPVYEMMTMGEVMATRNHGYSVLPVLMAGLALIAMALGVAGVYGVVAYWVVQRQREVGIRMALGAQRRGILALVMKQGLTLVGGGIALGLAVSTAVTRSLALFLFGVSPFSGPVYALVAAVLLAAGLAATLVPALRAVRVDPNLALRSE
jgi:putative ABC transport system permease protein